MTRAIVKVLGELQTLQFLSWLHSKNGVVMGEGNSFQSNALYQQVTADFNNNKTVPVGQAHWHNIYPVHYWASMCRYNAFV